MKMRKLVTVSLSFALVVCLAMISFVQLSQIRKIVQSIDGLRHAPIAMVLGAGLKPDGTASDALRDRVQTAVEIYEKGKVGKLLMTGDDGKYYVDEVGVMKHLAEELGVPSSKILTDGHGYRTYESCKRAREIVDIQQAIIVTQRFHLGRVLYLCSSFGIDVQGIVADKQTYRRIVFFTIRDLASSLKAWWDINIHAPKSPVAF